MLSVRSSIKSTNHEESVDCVNSRRHNCSALSSQVEIWSHNSVSVYDLIHMIHLTHELFHIRSQFLLATRLVCRMISDQKTRCQHEHFTFYETQATPQTQRWWWSLMFTGCYQTAPADQFRPEPVRGDQINPGPPMSSGLINFYYTKHLMIIFIKDWVKLAEPTGKITGYLMSACRG